MAEDEDTPLDFLETRPLDSTQPGPVPDVTRKYERGDIIADRYEVVERIGVGGMGRVFKVEDLALHELVALKALTVEAVDNPDAIRQFRREVKLARKVAHRNVVRTYDIGADDEMPFLTMEFIEGENLRGILGRHDLDAEAVAAIGRDIAAGLAAAHDVGVLHRDLKPENVLVGQSGRVAITDFGIAGALRDGGGTDTIRRGGVGTPAYMAPEQVRGEASMDHRADIFGLGVVLYEMLTGGIPWEASNPASLAIVRLKTPAPPVGSVVDGLPPDLCEIVDACLERYPDDRPSNLRPVQRELEAVVRRAAADGSGAADVAQYRNLETQRLGSGGQHPVASPTSMSAGQSIRLAVLPFRHGETDGEAELARGIREDLVYRLSYRDRLEIRLRDAPDVESVAELDAVDFGRKLGVDAVVRGAVRREDDEEFSVRAALIIVDQASQVWGDVRRIDRGGVGTLVRTFGEAIGAELDTDRTTRAPAGLETPAHTLLMEGQHLLRERWFRDLAPAIQRLEAAYDRASDHPRVLSQLAIARARSAFNSPEERETHLERAIELARRAIDLAGDEWAEPRYALAMAHFNRRSYGRAVATLRAALEREPEYAEAHELLGRIFMELGPLKRAIEHLEHALDYNPYLYRGLWDLMRGYGLAGDWEKVVEIAELEIDSPHQRVARAMTALRLRLWREETALERIVEAERAELEGPLRTMLRVVETGEFGDGTREAYAEMVVEEPSSRRKILMCQAGAEMALRDGDVELGLDYLDRAIDAGLTDRVWLRHCPLLDAVRDDLEFVRRFERVRGRVESLEYQ